MIDDLILANTTQFRKLDRTEEELINLVKRHQENTALYALKMGQALQELKEKQPNKTWSKFVEANFTFKTRTADRLIQGFTNALEGGLISIKADRVIEVEKPLPTPTKMRKMHKPNTVSETKTVNLEEDIKELEDCIDEGSIVIESYEDAIKLYKLGDTLEAKAYFMEQSGMLPHMKSGESIVEMMEAHKELTKRVNELMTFANTVKFKDLVMNCVRELDGRII